MSVPDPVDRRQLHVVGGGITGLTAAWEATRRGVQVVLHEATSRLGGVIRTSTIELPDGSELTIDEAADAFLARVPDAIDLCSELGLAESFTEPSASRAMVYDGDSLQWFPAGAVLGVPLDPEELTGTGLLDDPSMVSLRAESGRNDPAQEDDTSVGAFLRARFGDQLVDRVVGPLVGGISAGDVDSMSLQATTPQLADAAASPGSLTDELRRRRGGLTGGPVFHGLRGGTQQLTDALAHELHRRGVVIRTDDRVGPLSQRDLDTGDYVITTGAPAAGNLVADLSPPAAELLNRIRAVSVVLVTYVFDRGDPLVSPHVEPTASGYLIPRDAGLLLTAVSWGSNKWAHWDDGRHLVVRASAGHSTDQRVDSMTNDEVATVLLDDLRTTSGLAAQPLATRVSRWPGAFHQYEVGHLDLVTRIESLLEAATAHGPGGGVALAGSAYRGVGIPACIRQARAAVEKLLDT